MRDEVTLHDTARTAMAIARCRSTAIDPDVVELVRSQGARFVRSIRSLAGPEGRRDALIAYWRVTEARCSAGLLPDVDVPLLLRLLPRVGAMDTRVDVDVVELQAGSRLAVLARLGDCGTEFWPVRGES